MLKSTPPRFYRGDGTMQSGTTSPFNRFLENFQLLLEKCNGSSNNLVAVAKGDPALHECAKEIWDIQTHISKRLNQRMQEENVPAEFASAWSDYRENWHGQVIRLCLIDEDDFGAFDTSNHNRSVPTKSRKFFLLSDQSEPDLGYDDEFDPLYHQGIPVLDWLESYLLENTEEPDSKSWSQLNNCCKLSYEYLQFIREGMGLDLRASEKRWRQLPMVVRPPHVSSTDLELQLTLWSNLDNARLAFVCGATRASIALCRATLEFLISEFYVAPADRRDRKGKGLGLKEMISVAARNHSSIKQCHQRLLELKKSADEILHRVQSQLVPMQDKLLVDFLEILSELINDAPLPGQ